MNGAFGLRRAGREQVAGRDTVPVRFKIRASGRGSGVVRDETVIIRFKIWAGRVDTAVGVEDTGVCRDDAVVLRFKIWVGRWDTGVGRG